MVRLAVGASLFCLSTGCASEKTQLQLAEDRAYEVPADIAGVVGSPSGALIGWTADEPRILLLGEETREIIHPDLNRVAGVGVSPHDHSIVEALDAATGKVLRFDRVGTLRDSYGTGELAGSRQAVRAATGWYALVPLSSGDSIGAAGYGIVFQPEDGSPSKLLHAIEADSRGGVPVRLSVRGDEVVATHSRSPYQSLSFDRTTGAARVLTDVTGLDSVLTAAGAWQGMPLLPVDSSYLQVFVDQSSDDRVLVLYGSNGKLLRATSFQAPLAIVTHHPDGRHLLGVRRVGKTEIVTYRWRWVAATDADSATFGQEEEEE